MRICVKIKIKVWIIKVIKIIVFFTISISEQHFIFLFSAYVIVWAVIVDGYCIKNINNCFLDRCYCCHCVSTGCPNSNDQKNHFNTIWIISIIGLTSVSYTCNPPVVNMTDFYNTQERKDHENDEEEKEENMYCGGKQEIWQILETVKGMWWEKRIFIFFLFYFFLFCLYFFEEVRRKGQLGGKRTVMLWL